MKRRFLPRKHFSHSNFNNLNNRTTGNSNRISSKNRSIDICIMGNGSNNNETSSKKICINVESNNRWSYNMPLL